MMSQIEWHPLDATLRLTTRTKIQIKWKLNTPFQGKQTIIATELTTNNQFQTLSDIDALIERLQSFSP